VWVTAATQRQATAGVVERLDETHGLLRAMLDRETGLRGYAQTGQYEFLEPYDAGQREYGVALAGLSDEAQDPAIAKALARADAAARAWTALAERRRAMDERQGPGRVPLVEAEARKHHMDAFRAAWAQIGRAMESSLQAEEARRARLAVAASLALSLLVGGIGAQLIARRERRERRRREREEDYRSTQAEFGEVLQVVQAEADAYALVRRHLHRSLPDRDVVVLRRNNSENRLEPVAGTGDPELVDRLRTSAPGSCLATRLGRPHDRAQGAEPLLACELCGDRPGASRCMPLLVGGEVIGSVLVSGAEAFDEGEGRRVADSVAQSAPVLANLRNLALAEDRAATDALTGLPNRRAFTDTLNRMVADAGRSVRPLTAIAVDIDHFKHVNDAFGHDAGDAALAAVAGALASAARASDVVARYGGEEFFVLCPDTSAEGGAVLAEKLRAIVAGLAVTGLTRPLTASFGVASLPGDAGDAEELVRRADRALYAAKAAGRNRVERHAPQAPPVPVD
jgi:diguanylate cyclase (GGDEF)-like protein